MEARDSQKEHVERSSETHWIVCKSRDKCTGEEHRFQRLKHRRLKLDMYEPACLSRAARYEVANPLVVCVLRKGKQAEEKVHKRDGATDEQRAYRKDGQPWPVIDGRQVAHIEIRPARTIS